MSLLLHCPDCEREIPLDDVNPATDAALCRACNQLHSFAALAGTAGDFGPGAGAEAEVDLENLPRHVRLIEDPGADLRIVHRRISPAVLFLLPFTLVWGGGSMGGIYGSQIASGKFDPMLSLFGLPFLVGTIVLVSITGYLLLGRTEIAMLRGEGTIFTGVGRVGRTRHFLYDRRTRIGLAGSDVKVNGVRRQQAVIDGPSGRLEFGAASMRGDALRAIVGLMRREIDRA